MSVRHSLLFTILLMILPLLVQAQSPEDTLGVDGPVPREKKGSIFKGKPGKSMLFSLVIPGSGQWYNGSILRAHAAWAAVGGVGYVLHYNTMQYKVFRDAYKASVDGVAYIPPENFPDRDVLITIKDPGRLKRLRDEANANRQLTIIGFSLVWLANGIDAFVDAHLKEFDIDEDISFEVGPRFDGDANAPMRVGLFVNFR